jgi:hypothetical protein
VVEAPVRIPRLAHLDQQVAVEKRRRHSRGKEPREKNLNVDTEQIIDTMGSGHILTAGYTHGKRQLECLEEVYTKSGKGEGLHCSDKLVGEALHVLTGVKGENVNTVVDSGGAAAPTREVRMVP